MAVIELKEIQDAIEDGVKVLKGDWNKVRDADQKKFDDKVESILEDLKELSTKEDVEAKLTEAQKKLQDQFDLLATKVNEGGDNAQKHMTFADSLKKSLDENYEALKKNMAEKSNFTFEMKDFDWANFTGYAPYNTEFRTGVRAIKDDPFHWRNIIPIGSTSKGVIEYPKELEDTSAPNAWSDVAARASKPAFNPNLEVASNKVEWIAGIIKGIPISMIEDLPWLQSWLNRRALRALLKAEDNQILNGNGVTPQLDGLWLNSVDYDGSYTLMLEQIIDAAERQIADNENDATDAIISNTDKVSIILNKASTSGLYNLPEGAVGYVNGQLMFSGLRLYSTRQFAAGAGMVGDFREAEFVIRSAPRLRFFDQNEDDATKNVMMLRIEERAALAVYDANAFVRVGTGS